MKIHPKNREDDFVVIGEMDSYSEIDTGNVSTIPEIPLPEPMTDDPDALDLDFEDELVEENSSLVWISNLSSSIKEQHLKTAFKEVEKVTFQVLDMKTYVKYYALVQMKDSKSANEARGRNFLVYLKIFENEKKTSVLKYN